MTTHGIYGSKKPNMKALQFSIFLNKNASPTDKKYFLESLKAQSFKNLCVTNKSNDLQSYANDINGSVQNDDKIIICVFHELWTLSPFFFETVLQQILKTSETNNAFKETKKEPCHFVYKKQNISLSALRNGMPFPSCEYLLFTSSKKNRSVWYNRISRSAERFDKKLSVRDLFRGLSRKICINQNQKYKRFTLITFATDQFKHKQLAFDGLVKKKIFKKHIKTNENNLSDYGFFQVNRDFSPLQRGYGFWLWKPFLIADKLKEIPNNDVLCYVDSGDLIRQDPIPLLDKLHENFDIILNLAGSWRAVEWTKRDTFIKMDKDKIRYHEQYQIEAGFISIKKTDKSTKFIDEWFKWCQDFQNISDDSCILAENYTPFRDHRHDQAILNLLSYQPYVYRSRELNNYIVQNV